MKRTTGFVSRWFVAVLAAVLCTVGSAAAQRDGPTTTCPDTGVGPAQQVGRQATSSVVVPCGSGVNIGFDANGNITITDSDTGDYGCPKWEIVPGTFYPQVPKEGYRTTGPTRVWAKCIKYDCKACDWFKLGIFTCCRTTGVQDWGPGRNSYDEEVCVD